MCKVLDEAEARGEQKAKLRDIKNVMESFGVTIEKAMEALKIPTDQQPMYAGLVNAN